MICGKEARKIGGEVERISSVKSKRIKYGGEVNQVDVRKERARRANKQTSKA